MPSGNWGHTGTPRKPKKLNSRQRVFVDYYILLANASQAALKAGFSEKYCGQIGYQLLQKPIIQRAITQRTEKLRKELNVEGVLSDIRDVADADPNELIQHRRGACRYCWGHQHMRQYTPQEQRERRAAWEHGHIKRVGDDDHEPLDGLEFDEEGGIGFDPRKSPHEGCPECFGEGESRVFVPDSRKLSDAARKLYAGVKKTKDGIEIKMHDQAAAKALLGKHLGMFVDRSEVEHKGTVNFTIEGAPPAPTEKDPEA